MFFVLYDWKVTPSLTLNLGLRYELTSPWFDEDNRMNKLLIDAGTHGQTIRAGQNGDSWSDRALVNTDRNNWAPRVGLDWQPAAKRTARGGAGVFFGPQQGLGASGRMLANFPFVAQVRRQPGRDAPAFLLREGFSEGYLADLSDADNRPRGITLQHRSTEFPLPTTYQWNVSLQRQRSNDLGLTVAYVGSSSNFLLSSYNENAATYRDTKTEASRSSSSRSDGASATSPAAASSTPCWAAGCSAACCRSRRASTTTGCCRARTGDSARGWARGGRTWLASTASRTRARTAATTARPSRFRPTRAAAPISATSDVTACRSPASSTWISACSKDFRISERAGVQFRREVFNTTNHPGFGVPNRNVRSPAGGTIRGTNTDSRQMQLRLRIQF